VLEQLAGSNTGLFYFMCLVRKVEESLLKLFSEGKLSGTTHTCIGQESIAGALWTTLGPDDIVFSSHRCHGHFLARGGKLKDLFAEIMGRNAPICGGRGGSQHLHYGNFYSNGIQGGVVGNATGIALAEKLKGGRGATIAVMGDGTLGEGLVYESFNFASLRSLPILFLLEDNQYAQSTPSRLTVSGSMAARAEAFGIEVVEAPSADVSVLVPLVERCLERVRQQTPIMLLIHTYRLAAHSKGDDTRDPLEIAQWRERDPLKVMRAQLSTTVADQLEKEAQKEVDCAILQAEQVPFPAIHESGPLCTVPPGEFPLPWAKESITYVQSINAALLGAMERDPNCFVIGEDILDPYGGAFKASRDCSTRFPERTITTPISEAGIIAWSTGAALRGMRPIAEIMFGDFLSLAADQILNHASKYRWVYNNSTSVPMVIRTPMGGRRGYGPTHSQSIETMFAGISGLNIVSPSHLLDVGELLHRCSSLSKDPVLFIENKLLYSYRLTIVKQGRAGPFFIRGTTSCFPTLHLSLSDFDTPDLTLVTYGGSVPFAMKAAQNLLVEHECVCDLVIPSLVAPLPVDEIASFATGTHNIAVFEEGGRRAGWGAEVIASLVELAHSPPRRYLRLGAPDTPLPSSKEVERQVLADENMLTQLLYGWLNTSS
jgi:2-oxoisovalerate dehydrogenase E1 component